DVVTPYGKQGLVHIADTAKEFIAEAENIFNDKNKKEWLKKVDAFLATNSWNETWHSMAELIDEALENKTIKTKKRKMYV
ncbi:MAG TPA: glycosyltransferase family 1 protein, partial [Hanamia sp.]|nr:glycosyltransferase family 1 protein [Hanamia sp.]